MSVGEQIKGKFWVEASGAIQEFSGKWRVQFYWRTSGEFVLIISENKIKIPDKGETV